MTDADFCPGCADHKAHRRYARTSEEKLQVIGAQNWNQFDGSKLEKVLREHPNLWDGLQILGVDASEVKDGNIEVVLIHPTTGNSYELADRVGRTTLGQDRELAWAKVSPGEHHVGARGIQTGESMSIEGKGGMGDAIDLHKAPGDSFWLYLWWD